MEEELDKWQERRSGERSRDKTRGKMLAASLAHSAGRTGIKLTCSEQEGGTPSKSTGRKRGIRMFTPLLFGAQRHWELPHDRHDQGFVALGRWPGLRCVLPTVPHLLGHATLALRSWRVKTTVMESSTMDMAFSQSTAALASSGSVRPLDAARLPAGPCQQLSRAVVADCAASVSVRGGGQ